MNDELQPKNDLPKNPFVSDEEETWAHFFDLFISEFLGPEIFQFNLALDPAAELLEINDNETPIILPSYELYFWRLHNSVAGYLNRNHRQLPNWKSIFLHHIADVFGSLFAALVERRPETEGKGMAMRRGGPQGFQLVFFDKPPDPPRPPLPDFIRKLINPRD